MIETSSDLLRKTILGNFRKMFGSVRLAFENVLENLRKLVGNLWKIVKNAVISMFI